MQTARFALKTAGAFCFLKMYQRLLLLAVVIEIIEQSAASSTLSPSYSDVIVAENEPFITEQAIFLLGDNGRTRTQRLVVRVACAIALLAFASFAFAVMRCFKALGSGKQNVTDVRGPAGGGTDVCDVS